MTLREWCANLERGWDAAVAEAGEHKARIWRLYMASSRFGFDRNSIELHQFLGVRLPDDARSAMPLRPDWERARVPAPQPERADEPVSVA
jgi:cyclopropane-fatty-acyl-phospholipid synthase